MEQEEVEQMFTPDAKVEWRAPALEAGLLVRPGFNFLFSATTGEMHRVDIVAQGTFDEDTCAAISYVDLKNPSS